MDRIYHTWDEWECYPAGFYENHPPKGMTKEECEAEYARFLRNIPEFEEALHRVITEWVNSCEHYLTNENMNRIAWLGQASMCISKGIPSCFRGGFNKLNKHEQELANNTALKYLNLWLRLHGEEDLTMEGAASKTKVDLY